MSWARKHELRMTVPPQRSPSEFCLVNSGLTVVVGVCGLTLVSRGAHVTHAGSVSGQGGV